MMSKTTIYLVRHGESQANQRDLFLGHGDLDLTDTGRRQAQMTAGYLKNIQPDFIYSSDLMRAYETARPTAEHFQKPIIKEKGLREIDGGQWDFVPFPELAQRFPESFRIWLEDIDNARCDGGESVQELTKRVVDTITDIAQRHAGKVIFLFSHATPVRAFAAHCMGVTLSGAKAIPWPSNASVTKVEYDGASFCLMEYSIDHFMGDMATRLPENL